MHDPYAFVSAQCRQWLELYGNGEPFEVARREHPGQWVVVHDLRPLEFIGFLLFLHRPYRPVQVIRWDEETQVFMSRPYEALKWRIRKNLPSGPWVWWRSFIRRQTPTLTGLWWRLEQALIDVNERFDAWLRNPERRRAYDRH